MGLSEGFPRLFSLGGLPQSGSIVHSFHGIFITVAAAHKLFLVMRNRLEQPLIGGAGSV
jgi:hypothetical protein